MKSTISSLVGGFILGAARLATANFVGQVEALVYADGFLYTNINSAGSQSADLGSFPATKSFPLYLNVVGSNPLSNISLTQYISTSAAPVNEIRNYNVYNEVLYIENTPGAFAPVSFKHPGELTGGEVSGPFYQSLGFLSFSSSLVSGFVAVPVDGYTDIYQLYWSQSLSVPSGDRSFTVYMHSDDNIDVLTYVDSP